MKELQKGNLNGIFTKLVEEDIKWRKSVNEIATK